MTNIRGQYHDSCSHNHRRALALPIAGHNVAFVTDDIDQKWKVPVLTALAVAVIIMIIVLIVLAVCLWESCGKLIVYNVATSGSYPFHILTDQDPQALSS